jgi:hypothetical protein
VWEGLKEIGEVCAEVEGGDLEEATKFTEEGRMFFLARQQHRNPTNFRVLVSSKQLFSAILPLKLHLNAYK